MAILVSRSGATSVALVGTLLALWMALAGTPAHAQEQAPASDSTPAETTDEPATEPVEAASEPGTATDVEGQEPVAAETSDVEPPFDPTDPAQILRDIVFPVVGASSYSPSFGACRDGCTRPHEGIDIMTYGWKGVPVVAAHDGVVTWANVGGELAGCGIVIEAADGWFTVYSHLNTDQPGTDDGSAPCFPAGIEAGTFVEAGTLIGWVGDAGNAEETPPHLHFEINHPEYGPVDPLVSLDAARRIEHRWIDPDDLAALAPAFSTDASTVYVVPSHGLDLLAGSADEPAPVDVPVVPYDADDPIEAWSAIRAIEPERIVIVTDDSGLPFIADLMTAAAIVEVVVVEESEDDTVDSDGQVPADASVPVDEQPAAPADGTESSSGDESPPGRIDYFDSDDAESTIVLVTRRAPRAGLLGALADHTVVSLVGAAPRQQPGAPSIDTPGSDANRNGLWWPSADGWLLTEDPDTAPEPAIAYVAGSSATPWTITYLVSLDGAPRLPLWHHQPTSRTTRSL